MKRYASGTPGRDAWSQSRFAVFPLDNPLPASWARPKRTESAGVLRPGLRGHLEIARFDHWIKNVFVLPGLVIALSVEPPKDLASLALRVVAGFLSVGFIASSNYVLNELLDAPFDRFHPVKSMRPVPAGRVSIPWAYVQWLVFMLVGMLAAVRISNAFAVTMATLWVMGIIYNVPPIRSKDKPYLDVVSESVNNPLRMLAGWFIARSGLLPPASLLVSYWMVGCYFMAIKRYAEYREINDAGVSAAYRKSFGYYNERRLLVSIMFYAAFAMLSFGAFIVRYRLELVIAFPLVALVMAIYLNLAFETNSAVQNPEYLYRQKSLMVSVSACAACIVVLMFVDLPAIYRIFTTLNSPLHFRQ